MSVNRERCWSSVVNAFTRKNFDVKIQLNRRKIRKSQRNAMIALTTPPTLTVHSDLLRLLK